MNLYQRINEVRKEINYVKKDKNVGTYKAVTHDQVTGMVRQHMVKHGIVSYPVFVEGSMNLLIDQDGNMGKQARYEATYDFVFVNADEPQETLTIRVQSHGMDSQDKAPGKALSYAKKYAILKLFEIETGEDEESRYQGDGFDFNFYIELMNGSKTLEELQVAYLESSSAATKAKDHVSLKAIIKHKDDLKARLK
jgi:hypothetical protein